ncbi:MAG: hypothetical protein KGL53_05745 [Elusimicrobia bacterium]|nr:hypothetical protein [Elusimicrobiota bacterium]
MADSNPDPEAEELRLRRKKTLWLLAGGALSLLIPLLGAIYLHWSQSEGGHGPTGRDDVFDRRDSARITPSQTVVVQPAYRLPPPSTAAAGGAPAPAQSSLDFIRPTAELKEPTPSAAPQTAAAPKPEAKPKTKAVVKARPSPKKTAQAFVMPQLQPTRGFTSMQGFGQSAQPAASGQQGQGKGQGQSMQDYLKNLPPGAENDPRVQQYLKEHGAAGQ